MVTNFKGKPLPNEIVLLVNEKSGASYKIITTQHGKFDVLVPIGTTYDLRYKNFTTDMSYSKLIIPSDPNATYEVGIKIDPPREFVLDNVYFDSGKAILKPSSSKALNDLTEVLKIKNKMVLEIQGHTDDVGVPADNVVLSQARADAVKEFLVKKGIPSERIRTRGYGPTQPIADNSTEQGKAKNRRTSVKVLQE